MTKTNKEGRLKERQERNWSKRRDAKNRRLHRNHSEDFITYKNSGGAVIHFKTRREFILYKEKMKKTGVSELNLTKGLVFKPSVPSEFEVQSYLYNSLLSMGVDVRGEVQAKNPNDRLNILDLVIFQENKAVMILEVKKDDMKVTFHQKQEYGAFGIPMRFILGMTQAIKYIERVRSRMAA